MVLSVAIPVETAASVQCFVKFSSTVVLWIWTHILKGPVVFIVSGIFQFATEIHFFKFRFRYIFKTNRFLNYGSGIWEKKIGITGIFKNYIEKLTQRDFPVLFRLVFIESRQTIIEFR